MPSRDDRRTTRIQCQIPARLVVPSTWPPVTVLDLSAGGLRLGLRADPETTNGAWSLGRLVRRFQAALDMQLLLEFDPERLGPLVTRSLRVMRLASPSDASGLLEVGCRVEPPLTDEEVRFLGLTLPREAAEAKPASEPGRRRAARQAALVSRERGTLSALKGGVEHLGLQGGRVWVEEPRTERVPRSRGSLVDALLAFERVVGPGVDMAIREGARSLWYGPVEITAVEAHRESGRLAVEFQFEEELQLPELEALDLV